MHASAARALARPARLRVVDALKRAPAGLPVRALSEQLGMSYMGVKEVCLDLEKQGLLETWRQPVPRGRPLMLYRLAPRAQELFPAHSHGLTLLLLDAARTLFGPTAPDKLLHATFARRAEAYAERVRGETVLARAESLARLRESAGCMCVLETGPDVLRLVEHHQPDLEVLRGWPLMARLEAELFTRVLQAPVKREETGTGGGYRAVFTVANIAQRGS